MALGIKTGPKSPAWDWSENHELGRVMDFYNYDVGLCQVRLADFGSDSDLVDTRSG